MGAANIRSESGVLTWPGSVPLAPGAQRHSRSGGWGQLHSEVCQSDLAGRLRNRVPPPISISQDSAPHCSSLSFH